MDSSDILKFCPFKSIVDASFWQILVKKKLDELKLDEKPVDIQATYRNDGVPGLPPFVNVDYDAFNESSSMVTGSFRLAGQIVVCNTLEEFQNRDKKKIIHSLGEDMLIEIKDGNVNDLVSLLSRVYIITFADLKKYRFYYWFAFPAMVLPKPVRTLCPRKLLSDVLSSDQLRTLEKLFLNSSTSLQSYFLVGVTNNLIVTDSVLNYAEFIKSQEKVFLGFSDPCSDNLYPGWLLRNLLTFVSLTFKEIHWNVICYRIRNNKCDHSLVFEVETSIDDVVEELKCTGWEKNEKDKLMPRFVDLSHVLDPKRLAENAVDLNLKLMRWRLIPDLDLESISSTRCLLLGSGTLGCNVARGLIAWGVRNITLVDNSKVSYSNPVRQSLFEFEDCLDGGKDKAQAAAERLKKIFPSVNSTGISLSIPMPGHFVSEKVVREVEADVKLLDDLISKHDVVFLLMDTRESRWLPTVISQAKNKIVINAALGFDTYLIQRHGCRKEGESTEMIDLKDHIEIPGHKLGCYFCNDVVAPGNSTKDRTLDQQCTVTRPGVSLIAAAYAVELAVSIIQHDLKIEAPAYNPTLKDEISVSESKLGVIPHQIRGFLSSFEQIMPTCIAFQSCTACSQPVISSYINDGFEFLLKAFNDPNFLEELTGLTKLHEVNADDVWAMSDGDDDEFDAK